MSSPLHFTVLHRQWLLLGLAGGLILMLGIVLVYTAGWRPREEERAKTEVPLTGPRQWGGWLLATFPWILIVTLVGVAIWTFLYPVLKALRPPNW